MSSPLVTVDVETSILAAEEIMADKNIRRLLVTEGEKEYSPCYYTNFSSGVLCLRSQMTALLKHVIKKLKEKMEPMELIG